MKLVKIRFLTRSHIAGLSQNDGTELALAKPPESLRGWRAHVRGPHLVLSSPPGWTKEQIFSAGKCGAQESEDGTRYVAGPRVILTFPMDEVRLEWSTPTTCNEKSGEIDDRAFEKSMTEALKSYSSDPMGEPLPPPVEIDKPRPGSLAAQLAKPIPPHEQGDD